MEGTGRASEEAIVAQKRKVQWLREQLAQEVLAQQEIEAAAAAEAAQRSEVPQQGSAQQQQQQQQHGAQPRGVHFTPEDLEELAGFMNLEGQPSRTEIGALQAQTLGALQAPTLESGLVTGAEMGGRDAQRQLAAGSLECVAAGVEGRTATGPEIGLEGPSDASSTGSTAAPRALHFSPEGSQNSSSDAQIESQTLQDTLAPAQGSAVPGIVEIGEMGTGWGSTGAQTIFSTASTVSGPAGGVTGRVTAIYRSVTAKSNGRGGSPREISAEMDQQKHTPVQQGAGTESDMGAWTPVLQYKTPTDGQDTPAQEEMLTPQVANMLSSSMALCDVHTATRTGILWYVLSTSGEPWMACVIPEDEQDQWLRFCAQTGVRTRNAGPEDEDVYAHYVVDLLTDRYHQFVGQVCADPKVLGIIADLGLIAEQRTSPESQKAATALRSLADSDDKAFLIKVVVCSQNWINAPAEFQAVIRNWAFNEIFVEVVELTKMELGVQRDQQDRFQAIEERLAAEANRRFGNRRNKKVMEAVQSALKVEPTPAVHSISQQLGEQMVVLKTLGNGHCLEAAISWLRFQTPGMAKVLVEVLLELYQDPAFADLVQLGLATCQAQGGDLQHVTLEGFLAGLKEGNIWSDHTELRMLCSAVNATVVVWQMDEELGIASPTCESGGACTIHLILQGQHYEALVSRARAIEYVNAGDRRANDSILHYRWCRTGQASACGCARAT